jgi:predicted RNA-binding Zn-ribbon protein involved in translation (DUF1610 family)
MLDAIKKGLIKTAYLSAWCSHAEEYGGREHGIYGGCRIEEIAPEVPYSDMADMADRVLSRLASAFVADAVFRADCLAAIEWFQKSVDWSAEASHADEYTTLETARDYPIAAALLLAAKADSENDSGEAWRLLETTDYADRFGSCLAYELVGAGVAWSDDHKDVLPRLPRDSRLEEHANGLISASCEVCVLPEEIEATRYEGKLPAFSSVGGYPLLYHGAKDLSYCAKCADDPHYRVKTARAYYEGVPYACDGCGVEIESAYGAPESAESEEG